MEEAVSFVVIFGVLEHVTSVSVPSWLSLLIVEQAGTQALAPLFKAQPLEGIRLLTLLTKLHWGPLRVEIMHSVVPSISRVCIELPAVLFFSSSPVRNTEALEQGTGLAVEPYIAHTL